jgi:DNA polymerase-3 subunit delta'
MREIQKKMNLKQYNSPYKILLLDHAENLNEEAANSLLKFLEEPGGETLIILITADIKAILPTIVSRCVVINFFPVGKKEMLEYFERIFGVTKQNFATGEAGASPPRYKEAQKLNLKELILYSYGRPGRVINWLKSPNEFLENKKTIEEFSKIIFSQSPAKKFQFISQFYRKKEDSLKLLAKLLILMQQLILIKIGREKAVFDRNLANLSKVYELDRIKTALLQIILARKLISHNVNLKLVLENMMLNL